LGQWRIIRSLVGYRKETDLDAREFKGGGTEYAKGVHDSAVQCARSGSRPQETTRRGDPRNAEGLRIWR